MGKVKQFVRDYTAGLRSEDLRRLFNQEAARTYAVLARDHAKEEEPAGRFKRFWHRARITFLGLSYKLTPPRRLLFAGSLILVLLGLVRFQYETNNGRVTIDGSPLWVILGVGGLVFLLALELADRVLIRDELEVARQLQRDLLPSSSPHVPGYRFAHSYRTANEVGGDYYDFPLLPDGRVALMAGDASGHGMAAGLVMAIANATLKLGLDLDPAPEKVAAMLNRALWRTGTRRNFMSLFYGILDAASGQMQYVCAGHPFPLLRRADGAVVELGEGGFPLGLRESVEAPMHAVDLARGDVLVIYSDGLPEARNLSGEPFGYQRVAAEVGTGGEAAEVHARLLRALDRFRGEEPLVDDVSLVVLSRD
jgi:sigma-B regulation protein RsbU (phosphoserine phosphatase)